MEEKKLPEAFKVLNHLILKIKKDSCRDMIWCLQNGGDELLMNHIYADRKKINDSFKYYNKH